MVKKVRGGNGGLASPVAKNQQILGKKKQHKQRSKRPARNKKSRWGGGGT